MKPHWVHYAVNSLPSSSTLNSVLELSGFLITKIKPKGRKEVKGLGRGEKVYLPLLWMTAWAQRSLDWFFHLDRLCVMPKEKHQELQEFRLCNYFVCHDKKVYKNLTRFTRTHLSIQNMQLGRITWKLLLFMVRLWKPVFSSRGGGIRSLFYLQRHGEEVWERHEGRLALSCSVMNSII